MPSDEKVGVYSKHYTKFITNNYVGKPLGLLMLKKG